MKKLLPLTLFFAFVSCGPAPELKRRPESFFQKNKLIDKKINLDNSSVAEVLSLKYDNKVILDCELKIMTGTGETSGVQKESFSWNLVNSAGSEKTLNIQVGERTLGAVVKFKTLGMKKSDSTTDAQGIQYEMKHTPFADIEINWSDSPVTQETQPLLLFLKEKLTPQKLIQVYSEEMLTKEISCALNTEIKEPFTDEWKAIAPVVEEEEVEVEETPPVVETIPNP